MIKTAFPFGAGGRLRSHPSTNGCFQKTAWQVRPESAGVDAWPRRCSNPGAEPEPTVPRDAMSVLGYINHPRLLTNGTAARMRAVTESLGFTANPAKNCEAAWPLKRFRKGRRKIFNSQIFSIGHMGLPRS